MLRGKTSIANQLVYNLPLMLDKGRRCFWQHLKAPHGSDRVISAEIDSQISHEIPDFGVAYQHWKWDNVSKGKIYIAVEVFHTIHCMYEEDERIIWQHLRAPCGSQGVISTVIDSQIAQKLPDLRSTYGK